MKRSLIVALALVFSLGAASDDKKMQSVKLYLAGLECSNCVKKVETALKKIDGVSTVSVSLKKMTADVKLASTGKATTDALIKAVSDAGFGAAMSKAEASKLNVKHKEGEDEDCEGEDDCCATKDGKKKEASSKEHSEKK
jgi:copper chaperone CopZ